MMLQLERAEDLSQRLGLPVSFVEEMLDCDRSWRVWQRQLEHPEIFGSDDILRLIVDAQNDGDLDEALWRAFLAGHFGRTSANGNEAVTSAGRFLYGFGTRPLWTWDRVSGNLPALRDWLHDRSSDLLTLRFGSHRKFEGKSPKALAPVIESFVQWVERHGGRPEMAFRALARTTPADWFDGLYQSLLGVRQFGRTGCFDLLVLIGSMHLFPIQPGSCYLAASTGPLRGAKKLWGGYSSQVLGQLADDAARNWDVRFEILESALCRWQQKN